MRSLCGVVRRLLAVAVVVPVMVAVAPTVPVAAAPAKASCADAASDAATAVVMARACGRPVEDTSRRTETVQVFADAGGKFGAVVSAVPQRVRRPDGSWAAVDMTLRRGPDGAVTPVASPVPLVFSGDGDPLIAKAARDGTEIGLGWPARLPVPTLAGDTATYAEVLPGVDLKVQASVSGFSEVLVVKTREAARNPALSKVRFATVTKGVTVKTLADGTVSWVDGSGGQVFRTGRALMWDSSGSAGRVSGQGVVAGQASSHAGAGPGARRAVMPVEATGDSLTVVPDQRLLADAALPAYIDPPVTVTNPTWSMINKAHPDQQYWTEDRHDGAKVGHEDQDGQTYRSMFAFDTGAFRGTQITRAVFSANVYHMWSCNRSSEVDLYLIPAFGPDTTWNKHAGGWQENLAQAWPGSCGIRVEFGGEGVRSAVQRGADAWPTISLGLRAGVEQDSGSDYWKKFDPGSAQLYVEFNRAPNIPDSLTVDGKPCTSGVSRPVVATATPTLRAHVSDPDGDTLQVWYAYARWNGSTFVDAGGGHQDGVPNGGTAVFDPPAGVHDGIYTWRAAASDGRLSSPATHLPGNCEWQVDLVDPAVPAVSSDLYREGSAGCPAEGCGAVGQTGKFTFSSSADVASYRWGWTDPPSTTVTPTSVGGAVTVRWTPPSGGAKTLYVQAIDRAGRTATKVYQFIVAGPSSALARWRLAEPAGATSLADATGHGHTATLNGGTSGVSGRIVGGDTAVRFGGTPTGNASAPHVVDTGNSFSVSAWVRVTDQGYSRTVVSQDGAHAAGFRLQFAKGCTCWQFTMAKADATDPGHAIAAATGPAPVGVWTHLVGAYDAGANTVQLYVDGALAATAKGPDQPWDAGGALTIGRTRWNDTLTDHWAGDIADVRVWDRVVAADEVIAMMDPLAVGNVGEWHMDEVGPGPAYDASGYLHHLTFHGGAAIPPAGSGGGRSGTGLRLDGSTGHADTAGPVVHTNQSFTVSAWVRLTSTADAATAVSQDGNRVSGFSLQYSKVADRWAMVGPTADGDSVGSAKATSAAPPQLNVWTHLVGVYDATAQKLKLYVNGQLQSTVAYTTAFDTSGPLAIGRGRYGGAPVNYWPGDIDEVRVYTGLFPEIVTGPNLAPGATVNPSSSAPEAWGWAPRFVNDGNRGMPGWSSWSSTDVDHTETLEIDFPAARKLNRVDLYPRTDVPYVGDGFPANFSIQVWDGTAWVTVLNRTGHPKPDTGAVQSFTFEPQTTSRIRIVGTSLRVMQFAEVEIYLTEGVGRIPDATS